MSALAAAGNFVYIAVSDLVTGVKHSRGRREDSLNFLAFATGITLLNVPRVSRER